MLELIDTNPWESQALCDSATKSISTATWSSASQTDTHTQQTDVDGQN